MISKFYKELSMSPVERSPRMSRSETEANISQGAEQSMSPVERNPRMRRSETEAKRLTPVTASTTPVLEQPIATPVSASELRT